MLSTNKKLFESLDDTSGQLLTLMSSLNETDINQIPFEDSWTAAQLASHITKSNKGIAQALEMEGTVCDRDPAEGAAKLKKMFLDFSVKYKSPEFILPTKNTYQKDLVTDELKASIERLISMRNAVNLSEIIEVPLFGATTKLELLYFVLYHTQRHLHQLQNIVQALEQKNVLTK